MLTRTQDSHWRSFRFDVADRSIDVWPVNIDAPDLALAQFERLLGPDELSRASRFRYEHLRRSFILARASLRILLSQYLGTAPSVVRFSYGSQGKPSVLGSARLRFNTSHSGSLVLIAFTQDCEIGVDLERIRPLTLMHEIATRFFSKQEADELMALPLEERDRGFFRCWTRKEAYVKALGQGLSAPLDAFGVTLRADWAATDIQMAKNTGDEAWTLQDIDVAASYAAALAYPGRRRVEIVPLIPATDLLRFL
jgi:4'-phosphopantetheinyl transferase